MKNFMEHNFLIEQIVLAIYVAPGKGANVHENRPSHGLALFVGGDRTFYFDKKALRITDNSIVYFPKGSNYRIKTDAASDCYAINFQMPDGVGFVPFSFKVKNLNVFLESFKSCEKIWTKKKTGFDAKAKAELYNIIGNLQAEYSLPYSKATVIQPAIEYIHSNYDKENISVTKLASLCDISTVYLSNLFVKTFSMPPVKYINNLKLNHARDLLASQMYTVSEVCFMSGFNDESYFSREFKKFFNISPSAYKKASRK